MGCGDDTPQASSINILRIGFFEVEKCKQFFQSVNFGKYESLACNWHPAGASFPVKTATLDCLDMQIQKIKVCILGPQEPQDQPRWDPESKAPRKWVVKCSSVGSMSNNYNSMR